MKFRFFTVFFLFCSSAFSQVQFELSANMVQVNEPIELRFVFTGSPNVKLVKEHFETDEFRAEFSGQESRTQILNFQMDQKKIYKYLVYFKKIGKFSAPAIPILLERKEILFQSKELIDVRKMVMRRVPKNLFPDFFGEDFSKSPEVSIEFQTNKKSVFVGEAVIGYFILYHSSRYPLSLERDGNSNLSFPNMISEPMNGVSVSVPDTVFKNGKQVNAAPYLREVFSLVPTKPGRIPLGKTKFLVFASPHFQSFPNIHESSEFELEVLPLPEPQPLGFSGEVGEYSISTKFEKTNVKVSEILNFTVTISGLGLAKSFKDPIASAKKQFPEGYSIHLVDRNLKTEFKEIEPNYYDFESSLVLRYSLKLDQEGTFPAQTITIPYFSLQNRTYETLKLEIPSFVAKGYLQQNPLQASKEKLETSKLSLANWYWFAIAILLGGPTIFFGFQRWKQFQILESVAKEMENLAGTKSPSLLFHHLLQKGFSRDGANLLRKLGEEKTSSSWKESLKTLSKLELSNLRKVLESQKDSE